MIEVADTADTSDLTGVDFDGRGLTAAEVADRVSRGHVNRVESKSGRSIGQIVRSNIFTRFNAILGSLFVLIVSVGPIQDALFGLVLVANALIGIIQELRAKRTLDRLVILAAPRAVVVRDDSPTEILTSEVVVDDLLELRLGDQVAVDGRVLSSEQLEIDESLLTGESEPIHKINGDEVYSGSVVVAGAGLIRAVTVGEAAYANDLAGKARRFTVTRSELRIGIDQILKYITWALVPTAALLVWSQARAHEGWREVVSGSVAGVVGMVPEGLVLLTSMAMAMAVLRLGRKQVLVQELSAVEGLARVDVVCLDKTGTLTEGRSEFDRLVAIDSTRYSESALWTGLAALGSAEPSPNASLDAIMDASDVSSADEWEADAIVPFSSARKWSGASFGPEGTWILGAPEVVLRGLDDGSPARVEASDLAASGMRVLALAHSEASLRDSDSQLPGQIEAAALIVLGERIRSDAPEALAYFEKQGVMLKVISGDNPKTVGAIAERLGIEGASHPVDARTMPEGDGLAEVMDENSVFGRVRPEQKRDMVRALKARGHTVAMTGDGVNDALALKDADIGIAMGAGSSASRAVAQIVLLDNKFATMPGVVAEGRRVIANIERTANLFLTKSAYVMLLALAVGVAAVPFPFLPRHLTIVGAVTIGIPAFFLSLAQNTARAKPGFVGRALEFALPAGFISAGATFAAFALTRWRDPETLGDARTAAALVLIACGLWILGILARPFRPWKVGLIASMIGIVFLVFFVPPLRSFYALTIPPSDVMLGTALIGAVACALLEVGWRLARRNGRQAGSESAEPASETT